MRFLIVSNIREGKGKGLARDAAILGERLADLGHASDTIDFRSQPMSTGYDVAMHLEAVTPSLLGIARADWYVVNPEWHGDHPEKEKAVARKAFARILCKTRDAERVMRPLTDRAVFVGFESEDRRDLSVKRERSFLFAPGMSAVKGNEAVCSVWREIGVRQSLSMPRGVSEEVIRREQNRCLFHLCPSEYEGWGHYLHEALSVGAVVITTDAPPMNDFAGVAIRVRPDHTVPRGIVSWSKVGVPGLRAAVDWCAGLSDEEVDGISGRARQAFEDERRDFRARFAAVVAEATREMACHAA